MGRAALRALLPVLLLALSAVQACTGGDAPDQGTDSLRIATPEPRFDLGPRGLIYSWASYGVGEQLIKPSPDGAMRPWLLERYDRESPLVWRMRLREGLKFHSGRAVDAEAVVAALRRTAEESGSRDAIATGTLTVTDPLEFTITTDEPDSLVPHDLGALYRHYVVYDVAAADAAGEDQGALVRAGLYTGPFEPVEAREREVVATRFEEYWGDRPAQRELRLAAITDPTARVSAVRNGEVDVAVNPPTTAAALDGTGVTYRRAPIANRGVFAQLNLTAAPFDDPAVRRAFLAGVDYARLTETAGGGVLRPASGLYPAELPFSRETQVPRPDRAELALGEAGWTRAGDGPRTRGGVPLEVSLLYQSGESDHESLGLAVRDQLAPLGFDVELTAVDDVYDSAGWPAGWSVALVTLQLDGSNPTEVLNAYLGDGWANAGKATSPRLAELIAGLRAAERQDEVLGQVQDEVAAGGYGGVLAFQGADLVVGPRHPDFPADPMALLLAPSDEWLDP
ncbi:ABC transporter substrate-binding protein [Saccharothrix xinjiangensis]|uniref:ABC transporter substrate-binding protein n=1 Tax=Saccharothrix xinjiangensis TaxID=204798 RepID=A0ABV9XYH5_9PSEU